MLSRQLMYCICADKQLICTRYFFLKIITLSIFVRAICHSIILYTIYVVYLAVALFNSLANHINIARPNVHHPGSKHGSPSIPHSQSPHKDLANYIFRTNRQIFNSPNNFTYTVVCLWFEHSMRHH